MPFIGYFKNPARDLSLEEAFVDAYIDIGFDERGQRHYISLNEAIDLSKNPPPDVENVVLPLHYEEVVGTKKKTFISLFNYSNIATYGFNIIDDLSFWNTDGKEKSRLMVLSDLSSLKKEGILDKGMPSNISLIVNCQDDDATAGMYTGLYF